MNKWLILSIGGVLGTAARYLTATRIPSLAGADFPYGTLVINLSACLVLGMFQSMAQAKAFLGPEARLFLMTGFCGAYSTFSTWILESSNLITDGEMTRALINLFGSAILGLFLFRLGAYLGSII